MLNEILKQTGNPSLRQKIKVVWTLSVPAILAQITSIMMQYIDTAMVGSLGADASAAIGLVSTTTWLMGGLCSGLSSGFSVQTANLIGAGDESGARNVLKHGLLTALIFSCVLMAVGVGIGGKLPIWLGAGDDISQNATRYFIVYSLSLPFLQLGSIAGAILQCSGNMKTPAILDASMCILDVIFNFIFIHYLGVVGAAIGTALAEIIIAILMLYAVCIKSPVLRIKRKEKCRFDINIIKKMLIIGVPMGFEHAAVCGAMIASTKIIASLGTIAIASNSIAVTAESICYMPGYGIASAATTLVGQSIGAGRDKLAKSFATLSVLLGSGIMSVMAVIMFFICPGIFNMLTPDPEVRILAAKVLRIELFAEPLFGASIVASGALRGVGDTLIPSILNLISIWGVRITLSVLMVGYLGLEGVWLAMCIELCVRGLLMLGRMKMRLGRKFT
jgi:putative MATE family efflux protein